MLWSDEVLKENSHEMKRLWLAGTIAAGLAANGRYNPDEGVVLCAVGMADAILVELNKGSRWEKKT
jgi:hypothetical protein